MQDLKRCEYCEGGEKENKDLYIEYPNDKRGDNVYIAIYGMEIEVEIYLGYESALISFEVNYCPMCGRKLGGIPCKT